MTDTETYIILIKIMLWYEHSPGKWMCTVLMFWIGFPCQISSLACTFHKVFIGRNKRETFRINAFSAVFVRLQRLINHHHDLFHFPVDKNLNLYWGWFVHKMAHYCHILYVGSISTVVILNSKCLSRE